MRPERFSGEVPREKWPAYMLGHEQLAGIFVGGCVDRGVGSSFRAQAHAHIEGPHLGWICIRGWRRFHNKSLLLHELAHVVSGQGHTDKWREMLRALGGRVPAHHKKKRRIRKPCACGRHRFGNDGSTWFVEDNMWHSWRQCRPAQMRVAASEGTP
jgi:hypothetical protein